jgi:hypothetical protein
LVQLLQPTWEPDGGALVPEVTLDLAGDSERGEGRELEPKIGIEAFDRLDQAEVADLDYVVERLAAVLKLARKEIDEVVIRIDEPGANAIALRRIRRLLVAAMERPKLLA